MMKVTLQAERETSEAAVRRETGKGWQEWFALLDAFGGPAKGRRELGNHLQADLKVDPWWSSTLIIEYENARGVVEKDGRPKGYTICATKGIKASAERCFAAFAGGPALDRWLGAGNQVELRDGGVLANRDGNRLEIRKVTPGKVFRGIWQDPTAAPGTPVEVKFQEAGGKCTVMITHDRLQTRAEADGLRAAWGEALAKLKAAVEAGV